MVSKKELNFYKNQGKRTQIEKGIFDLLPDDVEQLCNVIHGLLIHPDTLKKIYRLNLAPKRINDRNLKTVQEVLDKIFELDPSPLNTPRIPKNRVVGICRHYAMLLCSILRYKGIPARTRCGFATYFLGGWFEDHWICEYWNSNENRWIGIDPLIDDIQAVAYNIDRDKINFFDLPKGVFFPAGVLWKLYREGFVEGKMAGFSLEPDNFGEWYIRGNMLRDFFALNKIEFLYSEKNLLMNENQKLSKKELALLDKISEYTSNPDVNFHKLRNLYIKNKKLTPK